MARKPKSTSAAYTLVDLSEVDPDVRAEILEDAEAGGKEFGVRVVEEAVNGPARAPIYGVYKGEDAELWEQAKKDFNLSSTEINDSAVAGASGPATDPRTEAALRQAAREQATAEASRIRTQEENDLAEITGEVNTSQSHTSNIVDDTLALDRTNDARDAEDQQPVKTNKLKK